MKETQLKKEFRQKDVQRARNLISKNFTGKTQVGTGYSKKREKHQEGDIWEEDGRTWTIKDGIKQTINKLDSAKKYLQKPLCCPKCEGTMKHRFSDKMWKIHRMCYDCVIDYEAQLRKAGLYEAYEKQMVHGNIRTFAQDAKAYFEDFLTQSTDFVTEDGTVEEWKSNDKQRQEVLSKLQEYVDHINTYLDTK